MSDKCYFENGRKCKALTSKQCAGCKFRKTEKEYFAALDHANEILEAKGLKARLVDNVMCVTDV